MKLPKKKPKNLPIVADFIVILLWNGGCLASGMAASDDSEQASYHQEEPSKPSV